MYFILKVHCFRNKDNDQTTFWKDQAGSKIKIIQEEAGTESREISLKFTAMVSGREMGPKLRQKSEII